MQSPRFMQICVSLPVLSPWTRRVNMGSTFTAVAGVPLSVQWSFLMIPQQSLKTNPAKHFFHSSSRRGMDWDMCPECHHLTAERSSKKNITQQVAEAAIWWHIEKASYFISGVCGPCDHRHWIHYWLTSLSPQTPCINPCHCSFYPMHTSQQSLFKCNRGARVRTHHFASLLHQLWGYLWGHPREIR